MGLLSLSLKSTNREENYRGEKDIKIECKQVEGLMKSDRLRIIRKEEKDTIRAKEENGKKKK